MVKRQATCKLRARNAVRNCGGGRNCFFNGTATTEIYTLSLHDALPIFGIAALEAGLHIMVEKPISAHKADAERLIAAAETRPELTFSGMFQMRVEPRYQKIRELVQGGKLGDLIRVIWIMTDWFRAEAYYQSSD